MNFADLTSTRGPGAFDRAALAAVWATTALAGIRDSPLLGTALEWAGFGQRRDFVPNQVTSAQEQKAMMIGNTAQRDYESALADYQSGATPTLEQGAAPGAATAPRTAAAGSIPSYYANQTTWVNPIGRSNTLPVGLSDAAGADAERYADAAARTAPIAQAFVVALGAVLLTDVAGGGGGGGGPTQTMLRYGCAGALALGTAAVFT